MPNDLTIPSIGAIADVAAYVRGLGAQAKAASRVLAAASTGQKNQALREAAVEIEANVELILNANERDVASAQSRGLDDAFIDRLALTPTRIASMAEGLRAVAALPDPIGEISELRDRPSGIRLGKMRVPLGVIGMIYEARPNVTADAAALCLKSGNACILRGGSEATHSNRVIYRLMQEGISKAGLPSTAVQLVETPDRAAVGEMLTLRGVIDVIIPRGGKSLTSRIAAEARVPVIKHLDGVCHVYVDTDADLEMAVRVVDNAKTQRYSPCNAMESLLVARPIAERFLPRIAGVFTAKQVEMRGCVVTKRILVAAGYASVVDATEQDYFTEYLAPIVSIKVVDDVVAAIAHINHYGSAHTDAIITGSETSADRFLREVDSSSVLVNASTRFADGFEYGLGAEIGISTDKLHARGPVGLEGLTSLKWVVYGHGEIRT